MGKGNYAPPQVARENGYEMVYIDYLHEHGESPSDEDVRFAWNDLIETLKHLLEMEGYEPPSYHRTTYEGDLWLLGEKWLPDDDNRLRVGVNDYEGLYAAVVFYVDLDEDFEGPTPDDFLAKIKEDADTVFGTLHRDGFELRVRTSAWTSGPYTPPDTPEDTDPVADDNEGAEA